MKVVHVITGLGDGGAEHVLFKICKYDITNKHVVISLKGPGKYFSLLNKIGIKVYCLKFNFFSIFKFISLFLTWRRIARFTLSRVSFSPDLEDFKPSRFKLF